MCALSGSRKSDGKAELKLRQRRRSAARSGRGEMRRGEKKMRWRNWRVNWRRSRRRWGRGTASFLT